jgi:hypothetical protein
VAIAMTDVVSIEVERIEQSKRQQEKWTSILPFDHRNFIRQIAKRQFSLARLVSSPVSSGVVAEHRDPG